jgi:general secretion pathway protein H
MPISPSDQRRSEAGVTLFELLIVITVLALALTAIGNLARGPSRQQAVEFSARATVNILNDARVRAIGSGRVAEVLIQPDDRMIRLPATGRTVRLGEGVTLSALVAREASAEEAAILFFPDGTSTGGTLTIGAGDFEARILVHWLTGAVHVE